MIPQRLNSSPFSRTSSRIASLAALGLTPLAGFAAGSDWETTIGLSLKETFDSNVYIQDHQPRPDTIAEAAKVGLEVVQPRQESFVTSLTPTAGITYKGTPAFNLTASYSPDIVFYHSESSEDYVAHRGSLKLSGKWDQVTYELLNSAAYIDGNETGPTFGKPGDIPAIGGIPLRDRREAFVFRNGFKLTYPVGQFFLRPVCTTYFHNFKTDQRLNRRPESDFFTYENYIDRQDLNGGLDVGFQLAEKTHVVAGYRFGHQDQFTGPNRGNTAFTDSPYDSDYHRILVGIEGSPAEWIKLAVLAGPDIRNFSDATRAEFSEFDQDELLYWVDASITLLPTKQDTITLLNRRYEQPAFSSQSVYEDITYSLAWKHKFDDHWTAGAGFQVYLGDWQAPVNREDWIYTPSAAVTYTLNRHFTAELSYSYDWVDSKVPNTEGREFTRHLVGLWAKYTF